MVDGRWHGVAVGQRDRGGRERGADLLRVLPDQHGVDDPSARRVGERLPRLALALAPRNQHDPAREALERLERRRDVGALGVVEVLDAPEIADPFDPVRDPAEAADRRADRGRGHARPQCAGGGGEDVFDVVLAAQEDLRQRADLLDVTVELGGDPAIAHEHAVRHRRPPAEPQHRRRRPVGQGPRRLVVEVEHRAVGRRLIREDPRLRVDVRLEASVAIEVVGRQVQHHRHPRLKELGGFELEARRLAHDEPVGRERERVRRQRRADVAGDQDRTRLLGQHGADERRGGGLAVRPGDRDRVGLGRPPAELELADDRDLPRAGRSELIAVERDTGAHHYELGAGERRGAALGSGVQVHADLGERGHLAPQRAERLGVDADDVRVGGAQEASRGDAAARQADHRHAPAAQRAKVRASSSHRVHLVQPVQRAHAPVTGASAS